MNRCKKEIMKSLWQLLGEYPYHKITVKMIVERCGVNRNTFYYYFQDIPALIEELLKNYIDILIERHCRIGSLEECISLVVNFLSDYKNVVMHLYKSVQREAFMRYLDQLAHYMAEEYIKNIVSAMNLRIEKEEIIIRTYKCLLVGILLDWLDRDMSYDLLDDCIFLCKNQEGTSIQLLINASTKNTGSQRESPASAVGHKKDEK